MQHVFRFNTLESTTGATVYSPTLAKVIDGENSITITGKHGSKDTELVIVGNTLSQLVIQAKQSGPEMVDLGLSVKWMKMNLGATSEEQYGKYFAWGETVGYTSDQIGNAKNFSGEDYTLYSDTKISNLERNSELDEDEYYAYSNSENTYYFDEEEVSESTWAFEKNEDSEFVCVSYKIYQDEESGSYYFNKLLMMDVLDAEHDAVTVAYGSNFRMPTKAEEQELLNSSFITKEVTTINGVSGTKFTSTKEGFTGNYIFVPFAGYGYYGSLSGVGGNSNLWSSSIYDSDLAWYLCCYSDGSRNVYDDGRYSGYSVRGVSDN